MSRLVTALATALAATLFTAAPALADPQYYLVEGLADGTGSCSPYAGYPGAFTCSTLRAAVTAANANPDNTEEGDLIALEAAGTYQVAESLDLAGNVSIVGRGPRTTGIASTGLNRVFTVPVGASAFMSRFAISHGFSSGAGGNVLVDGSLYMTNMRVSDGMSQDRGGGIALEGAANVLLSASLVDDNHASTAGGGVSMAGDGASLAVVESTVAFNQVTEGRGGGIALEGTNADEGTFVGATIARNAGDGIYVAAGSPSAEFQGSLVAGNTTNCAGPGITESTTGSNVAGDSSCGFIQTGDPGLSTGLVSMGGDTDVVTIANPGAAKHAVNPCVGASDQRSAPRNSQGACDAGAFEEGAAAPPIGSDPPIPDPGITPPPTPTPTPTPTAPPAPTPTPAPTPAPPVAGKNVDVQPSGTVLIKLPNGRFVPLAAGASIPLGSEVDTTHGTVTLSSQSKKGGPVQTAQFSEGIFKVTQSGGYTDLTLTQPLAACPKKGKASSAAKKPKTRHLWGDGSGNFRTRGHYSAATVRGTKWLVQDSCAGTLTRVTRGVVSVRDNVKHKTVIVRAGHKYLAKP